MELRNINSDAISIKDALRQSKVNVECLESKIRALESDARDQEQLVMLQITQLAEKVGQTSTHIHSHSQCCVVCTFVE